MMEWQPIKTAPHFKVIEVGGWYASTTSKYWGTEIARKGLFFWGGGFNGDRHTHWRYLGEPPKETP